MRVTHDESKVPYQELVEALEGCLYQDCWNFSNCELLDPPNMLFAKTYDSGSLGLYADALRVLARLGRVEILYDVGRRVIAVPVRDVERRGRLKRLNEEG